MLNKTLTISLLFICLGNLLNAYPIQTYVYEDENIVITVTANLHEFVSNPLYISFELESKKDELFVFKDLKQMDNYKSNILSIEYGGMFESTLDQYIDMIILNKGDKWVITKKFNISKYKIDDLLKISLSVGFIYSKKRISDNRYLSHLDFTVKKNTTSISSIVISACLDRLDLGIFSIKVDR